MSTSVDGVVLFSGGLDSLLAVKVLEEQGLSLHCLHFYSPFYGAPKAARRWKRLYGVDVEVVDAGGAMADLLRDWPPHGFGKVMNPCVDCKILQLRLAKRRMEELGAKFVATGEVVGQRPMSQRKDVMNTIRREAGVDGLLLRPLSALRLDPTPMEESGLVDRSRLLGISGRGRLEQLELAKRYGFEEIPSPGGGCLLTERENARRYWPVRTRRDAADAGDYWLADVGRQYWLFQDSAPARWLVVGRNNRDNDAIKGLFRAGDLLAGLCDYAGPLSLLRGGEGWSEPEVISALGTVASYSPKAMASGEKSLRFWAKSFDATQKILCAAPDPARSTFSRMSFDEVKEEKHAIASRKDLEARRLKEERKRARAMALSQDGAAPAASESAAENSEETK